MCPCFVLSKTKTTGDSAKTPSVEATLGRSPFPQNFSVLMDRLDGVLPPPEKGFSDIGVLEDGDVDVGAFAELMRECPYMMDLDGCKAKADGQVEVEAVGRFTPIWRLLRFDDVELNRTEAKRRFKGLLQRAAVTTKRNTGKEQTHIDMSGGKFHIPFLPADSKFPLDTEETFLKLYALVYLEGHKMWFIEQRTPVFRLFMDLDFKQPEALSAFKIEAVTLVVSRSVRKFWPEDADASMFRVVCCTTSHKTETCSGCVCACVKSFVADPLCDACRGTGCTGKSRAGKACDKCNGLHPVKKKTGVHLIWPELFVTTDMCLDMRETVLADLISTFGQRSSPFNAWRDVVDAAVYNKSGLRMLGSRKTDKCIACNGKRKADGEDCIKCGRMGRVDVGRPYAPLFVTNGLGRRDLEKEKEYEANYYQLLLDCKIRSDLKQATEGWAVPEGAPTFATSEDKKGSSAAAGGHRKTPTRHTRVQVDSPEAEALQVWFRSCPQPAFRELIVTSVLKTSKATNSYIINVTGHNCTFCQNVGRCHRSNRIFFVAGVDGIKQRCHDSADTADADMKYGLCRDYASAPMPLTSRLVDVLFPRSAEGEAESVVSDPHSMFRGGKTSELKLLTLLKVGNRLSRDLFNMDWSTSSRFASSFGDRLLQVQTQMIRRERETSRSTTLFRTFHPEALGSKSEAEVLRSLGFETDAAPDESEAPAKRARVDRGPPTEADKLRDSKSQLVDLKDELVQILNNIVSVCLNADKEEEVVETLRKQGFAGLGTRAKVMRKRPTVESLLQFDA